MVIVNDTSTLNGALAELGSLMAQNLTTQGLIGVSASDGLTTLANDILLIQGGGGGDLPTILFEDACNSSSGLSNYGTARNSRNENSYSATLTVTDSSYYTVTQNTNTANGHIPITPLTGAEDIKITMETYTPSGGNTGIGLMIWNSTSSRLGLTIQDDGSLFRVSLINGTTIDSQITTLGLANKWITQEYTIDSTNNALTLKLYDGNNTLVYTYTDTLKITIGSNTVYGIDRQWYTGDARIRNIKAETLGGSPCSQYIAEIDSAIEYINGSGS